MAEYKGIRGFTIESLASDPTNLTAGQIWYNTTTTVIKGRVAGAGAWSSGGNCNNKNQGTGNLGTQTAAMYAGGKTGSPTVTTSVDTSETYNGSTWTETNDLTVAVYANAAFGTTTAAASCGGRNAANSAQDRTEEFNGTCWSTVPGTINTARAMIKGCGIQTAGLIAGGTPPDTAIAETYNGSAWTEVADLNTARNGCSNVGTTTAALAFAGVPPPTGSDFTESYNGTCWTELNDLNTPRGEQAGWGTQTAAMIAAGQSGPGEPRVGNVEQWDGTSWTEVADGATPRKAYPGAGTSGTTAAGVIWGGADTPTSNAGTTATEEWNDPVFTTVTFTAS